MSKSIDPFSHPDTEELPLREAAKEAHRIFTEDGTGEHTGVKFVAIGRDRIMFYCHDEKAAEDIPESFRGWPCEIAKTSDNLPQPYNRR